MSGEAPVVTGTGPWPLPVAGPPIAPVDPGLLQAFSEVSSATACAKLHAMGITRTFLEGPRTSQPGRRVVGRAVTLQMMPMREDVYTDTGMTQEYVERHSALWSVLDSRLDSRPASRPDSRLDSGAPTLTSPFPILVGEYNYLKATTNPPAAQLKLPISSGELHHAGAPSPSLSPSPGGQSTIRSTA